MSGFGAIFVFIGVMPVLTNIIVTTTASSNLLSPGVPRLFVSDLCQAPIPTSRPLAADLSMESMQNYRRSSAVSAVWGDA